MKNWRRKRHDLPAAIIQFSFTANGVELRAEDWVMAGDVGTIDFRMLKVGD